MSEFVEPEHVTVPSPSILLTGGTGYIGSHTLVELYAAGYQNLIVVDSLANSSQQSLEGVFQITGKRPEFYRADLALSEDMDFLESIFRKHNITAVIHFAAFKAVRKSMLNPLSYYTNNVVGLINLMNVMSRVCCKKIIFSSSSTVYGDASTPPFIEDVTATGSKITNPYGQTKHMCEQIIRDASNGNGFQSIILRYFNPIGSHPSGLIGEDPMQEIPNNLFPFILRVAIGKLEKLTIFGDKHDTPDGTCVRDFTHVCDLADAHVKAIAHLNNIHTDNFTTAYNVGMGRGTSVRELVETFCKIHPIPYEYGEAKEGDIDFSYCDCSKAQRELGFTSKYSIYDACLHGYNYICKKYNCETEK